MEFCNLVNVFHGSGEVHNNNLKGIAKTWQPIKALCGNTHPHACFPFGQISCGAYSGGYSTGYGNHKPNSNKPPEKFLTQNKIRGFSHCHCTGTGALGLYYNYAVVSPFSSDISTAFDLKNVEKEEAFPSYYKAILQDKTICEVTVNENCAYHKYTQSAPINLAIDFSNDGLDKTFGEKFHAYSKKSTLEIISKNEVQASVIMQGLVLYFYVVCEDAQVSLFNEVEISEKELVLDETINKFGCIFKSNSNVANIKIAFSLKSFQQAKAFTQKHETFEQCQKHTQNKWNEYLSAIQIEASEEEKTLLYSNLYHSLIKPSDFTGQSQFFSDDKPYMIGFETLWDQYKTQLPLIFTLYPQVSEKIINSYIYLGEALGLLPHTLALSNNYNLEAVQACALPEHMIIDAYYRGIKIHDKQLMFNVLYSDMKRIEAKLFDETGKPKLATHILDFSDAVSGLVKIAKLENQTEWAEKFSELQKDISFVFDEKTGLLSADYSYYEGNHWNYSFRLLSDMDKRIKLAGGSEKFEDLLDIFFGYSKPNDKENRFEGFNNETDMETPFAYHYIDRHDKISEVISSANEQLFFVSTAGIPGNNDTGGLSSLYVYNAIGIFPVTGQDLTIIGAAKYEKTTLNLSNGNELTIKKSGDSIYVDSAYFNGEKLCDLTLKTSQLMAGGTLKIIMKEEK